jgi:hypothetical protein
MAKINDAEGLYATLGYNFDDPNKSIQSYPEKTVQMLEKTPPFFDSWMVQDVRDNNVGGYFKNPCGTNTSTIITTANTIHGLANGCSGLETIASSSNTLYYTATNFLAHTNRISGVTPWNYEDTVNPYYDNATSYAKQVVYVTNQTDNITNTSVLMGSFTSVLVAPQVGANAAIFAPYAAIVQNSITISTDEYGSTTKSSNLSSSIKTTLNTLMVNLNTFLSTRQTHDVNFFTKLKQTNEKLQEVGRFRNLGNSESALLTDHVGSDKLLTRIE